MASDFVASTGNEVGFVKLIDPLGLPGEQGEVWSAEAPARGSPGRKVLFAVKISRTPILGGDDENYKRFANEFNILATLDHPNIVKAYTFGLHEKDGKKFPFYIMEFLGDDVDRLQDAISGPDKGHRTALLLRALLDTASALQHAHGKGLFHRDIKGSNILICKDRSENARVKLIDFGFGPLLGASEHPADPTKRDAGPVNVSSRRPPQPGKTPQHEDVWQLCYLFRDLLSSTNNLAPSDYPAASFPIDYEADAPRLHDLLKEWARDDNLAPFLMAENTDDFYHRLNEISRFFNPKTLPSSLKGAIRYFGIDELAIVGGVTPAFDAMRIPPRQLARYTDRIKKLITTEEFGALRYTRQLGFAHLVYPGAQGTRFEHAVGTYNLACHFILRLAGQAEFRRVCPDPQDLTVFLLAVLLHDVGHFPYAHQMEEFKETDLPPDSWNRLKPLAKGHVQHGRDLIERIMRRNSNEMSSLFRIDDAQLQNLVDLACPAPPANAQKLREPFQFLSQFLDGPIDLDKLDYVERDAHHCGVPYGNYLDIERIMDTLRVVSTPKVKCPKCGHERVMDALRVESTPSAAVPTIAFEKRGIGSLEQLAISRHQMYAHVYWHRAVRSAVVMFKHAVYEVQQLLDRGDDITNAFFSAGSDDRLLALLTEMTKKLADRHKGTEAENACKSVERLLYAVSGQRRELYRAVVDLIGDDNARGKYGYHYSTQRETAKRIFDKLRTDGFIVETEGLGSANVLIDCRVDNPARFEEIRIIDESGELTSLGAEVRSVRDLGEDFRLQACRVRVFVNLDALRPEYRSKDGRAKVGEAIRNTVERG
ncbi:MAG: protein kinase [Planctomycetota bacterium]